MQRRKVKNDLPRLVTDNSSFGSSEEDTILLSTRASSSLQPQDSQVVDSSSIQNRQSQSVRIRKNKQGVSSFCWTESTFIVDIPSCSSPTAKRIQRNSKIKSKEMRYSLQISPTDTTDKKDEEQKDNEKQSREDDKANECPFECLTPIEKEARIRHERRIKQKQERERKRKENTFFF